MKSLIWVRLLKEKERIGPRAKSEKTHTPECQEGQKCEYNVRETRPRKSPKKVGGIYKHPTMLRGPVH